MKTIRQATKLFHKLGANSTALDRRAEAFLCTARSGLLSLCVDIALKAHEDMGRPPCGAMVEAGRRLLTSTNLEGSQDVTNINWVCCTEFVGHYMDDHTLPKGVARNWKSILARWGWFLEHKGTTAAYCGKVLVETTAKAFLRKAAEGSSDWAFVLARTLSGPCKSTRR